MRIVILLKFEYYFVVAKAEDETKLPLLLNASVRNGVAIFNRLKDPKSTFNETMVRLTEYFQVNLLFCYLENNPLKLDSSRRSLYLKLLADYDVWPKMAIFQSATVSYKTILLLVFTMADKKKLSH